ncbi:MAG: transcription termination factor Rho [Phycisphaerae bacterium]
MPNDTIVGILNLPHERRDGQLRDVNNLLRPLPAGGIVPRNFANDHGLRGGELIEAHTNGKSVRRLITVDGVPPEQYRGLKPILERTALDPAPQLMLEHSRDEYTTRVMDILTPVGFGQRGLLVAPPRTGKTMLLQNIARGIHANHPEAELFLLLVDERPEEVTDMRRNVPGIVYASSNDNTIERHLDLAQLVIERAKRRVEMGKDVVVLLDSLTRLGRAFNVESRSGRTLSGGVDSRALEIPKRLFGAARRLEEGGSLTILASCLIDTGSRMDQVIFEEFKGTGNMELTLDRKLANERIWPALNIAQSGTRKEELLLGDRLPKARQIRKHLMSFSPQQALKTLLEAMRKHETNASLYDSLRA